MGGRGAGNEGDWLTVVGVAEDVAMTGLSSQSSLTRPLQMYHQQRSVYGSSMLILARAEAGQRTDELLPMLREVALALDPTLRIDRLLVAEDLLRASLDRERFTTTIMGVFALLALLLASIGLYGVVSQVVGQRTREIGIRMALGAGRRSIASIVVGRAGGATGVGIVVGAVLAVAGTSVLESRVFGLEALSFGVFVFAALVLAGAAVVAAWLPANRATRVDPVSAMRVE
jgi:ABC-type antimicrobial peptide transport system permease subunit